MKGDSLRGKVQKKFTGPESRGPSRVQGGTRFPFWSRRSRVQGPG